MDNFDRFTLKNLGVMFDAEGVITARALPKDPEKVHEQQEKQILLGGLKHGKHV